MSAAMDTPRSKVRATPAAATGRGLRFTVAAVAVALAFLIAAVPGTATPAAPSPRKPAHRPARAAAIPDSAIGLSRTSVFSTPAPPPVVPNRRDPGEGAVLPRAFRGAPPQTPHATADYLPITRDENHCLECHDRTLAAESGAVPISAAHYRDLRRAPGAERDTLAGARYVCVSCHVPVTGPFQAPKAKAKAGRAK